MGIRVVATVAFGLGIWSAEGLPYRLFGALWLLALWGVWAPRLKEREPSGTDLRWAVWGPVLCLSFGLVRGGLERSFVGDAALLPAGEYRNLEGVVLEPSRMWGRRKVFPFGIDREAAPAEIAGSTVWVEWNGSKEALHPGERWALSGRLSRLPGARSPGEFSLEDWLRPKGIRARLQIWRFDPVCYLGPPDPDLGWGLVFAVRYRLSLALERDLDRFPKALVKGLVFGDTSEFTPDEKELFRVTGTSHVTAASGFHLGLLLGAFWLVARWLGYGPWRWAWAAVFLVVFYAGLAGFSPSICRAGAAGVAYLVSLRLGRPTTSLNALLVAIWGLLLWRPLLLYEVGFQLSTCAVLGLLATFGRGRRLRGLRGLLLDAWRATFAAVVSTFPVLWATFGQFPVGGLVSNLLIGLPVKVLMLAGALEACLPGLPFEWILEPTAAGTLWGLAFLAELMPSWALPPASPMRLFVATAGVLGWFLPPGVLIRVSGLALIVVAVVA